MTATVLQVKQQLAALALSNFPAIHRAFPEVQVDNNIIEYPDTIPTTDLPVLIIKEGPVKNEDIRTTGNDEVIEWREYEMCLYVARLGEGVYGEAMSRTAPYFESFRSFFIARPSLGGALGTLHAAYLGDKGQEDLKWDGRTEFHGARFFISVPIRYPITYAHGE